MQDVDDLGRAVQVVPGRGRVRCRGQVGQVDLDRAVLLEKLLQPLRRQAAGDPYRYDVGVQPFLSEGPLPTAPRCVGRHILSRRVFRLPAFAGLLSKTAAWLSQRNFFLTRFSGRVALAPARHRKRCTRGTTEAPVRGPLRLREPRPQPGPPGEDAPPARGARNSWVAL